MKQLRTVAVDEKFADRLKILREGEVESGGQGFQRKLRYDRLKFIGEALTKNGATCPPILVGELPNEDLVVIDGQHRLEAWKRTRFPLTAVLYEVKNLREAAEQFIAVNAHQVKVGLSHRLKVDPSESARKIRTLASEFDIPITSSFNLIIGCSGGNSYYTKGQVVTEESYTLAKRILNEWARSKMWKRPGFIYSGASALRLVGDTVRKSKSVELTLRELKSMDWSKDGKLGVRSGTGFASQKAMKEIVYKHLAERVI